MDRPVHSTALLYLKAASLTLLIVLLYGKVLIDLEQDWWTQPNLSHGFLVPPLALYIAWTRRSKTFEYPAEPNVFGLLLSIFAMLMLVLGKVGAEFFLQRTSFVLLLAGLTLTFWGKARLTSLLFPMLLLSTMVPLPKVVYERLSMPLQLLASDVASSVAQSVGVTVFREGNVINLANITLGVEEACSGLNSISAIVVGAMLLGFVQCRRTLTRSVLVIFSVPLCIAVNVVRVAGTAILADYNPKFALGFYHTFSGWLVFLGGFAALWVSAKVLHRVAD